MFQLWFYLFESFLFVVSLAKVLSTCHKIIIVALVSIFNTAILNPLLSKWYIFILLEIVSEESIVWKTFSYLFTYKVTYMCLTLLLKCSLNVYKMNELYNSTSCLNFYTYFVNTGAKMQKNKITWIDNRKFQW